MHTCLVIFSAFLNTLRCPLPRIVLKHFDNGQHSVFRKAEKLTKQYIKIKSDLKYFYKAFSVKDFTEDSILNASQTIK